MAKVGRPKGSKNKGKGGRKAGCPCVKSQKTGKCHVRKPKK